jgi:hypothetical protein
MYRAIVAMLIVVVGGVILSLAAPAAACGCGAYVPDSRAVAVSDERALITWDGATEGILMSLRVTGRSDKAAWVMPVPSAAQVSLGDSETFAELDRLTAPRIETRESWLPTFTWLAPAAETLDTAGMPARTPVDVLSTAHIGPFEVTRLAADDSTALAEWLSDKGFPRPDGLDENLAPYVAANWEIVAIQLTPSAGQTLTGDLQPLHLSFASDTVVYPMRLSRAATLAQHVDLYLLAQHRMDPKTTAVAGLQPTLEFAGRIGEVSPALARYAGDGAFLTRWTDHIYDPPSIDGDYVFAPTESDSAFQRVIHRTENRGDLTGLILIGVLGAGGVATAVTLGRRTSRPHAK